jgi:enoyl-CoA hydratase/carnithine racemase
MSEQSVRERVAWTVTDGVADVRLTRPEKMNAIDPAMFAALGEAGDEIGSDPSVRAVVLSGEGRAFCAGLDIGAFFGGGDDEARSVVGGDLTERHGGRVTNVAQHAVWAWAQLPVPVIAAVHGVALGGGLQVALGADLRIVAPDARLSVLEIRWGMVPDMCGTYLLPRLVKPDVAKELTWTGRMVEGEEAVRLGLATRVADDPRGAALELARQIAGANPDAVRRGKALLDAALDATTAEQFVAESKLNGELIGSPNQVEAVSAFLEKRPPAFADPA